MEFQLLQGNKEVINIHLIIPIEILYPCHAENFFLTLDYLLLDVNIKNHH